MKVILLENVIGLGRAGDIKEVKSGYARNYLIPQRLVELATRKKESYIKKLQEKLSIKAKAMFESSLQKKEEIQNEEIIIKVKAGEKGKLFGSVTNADITERLNGLGYKIDKRKVIMGHVKELGDYPIKIRLDDGVTADVIVKIVDEAKKEVEPETEVVSESESIVNDETEVDTEDNNEDETMVENTLDNDENPDEDIEEED